MDKFFDYARTGIKLEAHRKAREAELNNKDGILAEFVEENHVVQKIQRPESWMVATYDENTTKVEAAHVTVHGVVSSTHLLPFNLTTHPIPTKRIVQMRQSVCVSGLGNAKFTAAMDNLASTFQAMSAALPPTSTVDTWKRSFSNESPTLDIGCRLFTELRVSGFHDDNSFRECEDPTGSMAALKGSKYIHGTDNMVYYGRWNPDAESQEDSTTEIEPQEIQAGDIVEVALSMVCVSLERDKRYKMLPVLRAIIVLDSSEREASISAKESANRAAKRENGLKRKRMYDQKYMANRSTDDPRRKFAKLSLE